MTRHVIPRCQPGQPRIDPPTHACIMLHLVLRLFYGCSYMFHLSGDNSRDVCIVLTCLIASASAVSQATPVFGPDCRCMNPCCYLTQEWFLPALGPGRQEGMLLTFDNCAYVVNKLQPLMPKVVPGTTEPWLTCGGLCACNGCSGAHWAQWMNLVSVNGPSNGQETRNRHS